MTDHNTPPSTPAVEPSAAPSTEERLRRAESVIASLLGMVATMSNRAGQHDVHNAAHAAGHVLHGTQPAEPPPAPAPPPPEFVQNHFGALVRNPEAK